MQKQLVHFHNELTIREYEYTDDLETLEARIRHDIGNNTDVERMTYKVPHSEDLVVLNPELFATMSKSPEGIIDVILSVGRKVKYGGEEEERVFYAVDLDGLVEKIEAAAGKPVDKIAYAVTGPNNSQVEFQVLRDTFAIVSDAVYTVHFGKGVPQPEVKRRSSVELVDVLVNVMLPNEEAPVKVSICEGWLGLIEQLHELAPEEGEEFCSLTYTPESPPEHPGPAELVVVNEVELTEETFYELPNKTELNFFAHYKHPQSLRLSVNLGTCMSPKRFNAGNYDELVHLVEKVGGRVLDCLRYKVTGPHGQQLDCVVDEESFAELETVEGLMLEAVFHDDQADPKKPRRRVLMPGEEVPVCIAAATHQELQTQLRTHLQDASKITCMRFESQTSRGELTPLDEKTWDKLTDPETDLIHVYTTDTIMRLVRLPGSTVPERVMAESYEELLNKIQQNVGEDREVQRITFQQSDEEETLIRELDRLNYDDIADNSIEFFVWLCCPGDERSVQFPGEEKPRIFHAANYEELLKDIETHSGLMVSKLYYEYRDDDDDVFEVELTPDTLEALEDPATILMVQFKEVPVLKIRFTDEENERTTEAEQLDELHYHLRKLRPGREIDKLTYTVCGPKGQKLTVVLDEESFEEVASDPEGITIQVHLLPPTTPFDLEIEGQTITLRARDYSGLRSSINTAAGGQVIDSIAFQETADGAPIELTEETWVRLNIEKPPVLKCTLAPVQADTWYTLNMKFPFETVPRKISGVEWDGVLRELAKQAPVGFTDVERVVFMERKSMKDGIVRVEKEVTDEAHLEDAEEDTIFYVDFKWDPNLPPPTRVIKLQGPNPTDEWIPVQALKYPEFMSACKDAAQGHPVQCVSYETCVDTENINCIVTTDNFMDLPLDTKFLIEVGDVRPADGVQVKFGDEPGTIVLAAHTYERLLTLIDREALKKGRKVDIVTYEVEAPNGTLIELDDLCEDVFAEMDDMENVLFKVHLVGETEGLRRVKFDDSETMEGIVADTYQELIEKITQLEDETPIDAITYEVPAPSGHMVQFPLDEASWEDVKDDLTTVFHVHCAQPTDELEVQFPWCKPNSPTKLPAGSYDELLTNVGKSIPGDQELDGVFYTVIGPWGGRVELPLDENCFEEIEDADQMIIVKTKPTACIKVQYPPHSLRLPMSYVDLLYDMKQLCPPNKLPGKLTVASENSDTEITEDNWEAVVTDGCSLKLEYQEK